MITKRIIPCLDVKDGRVVKGVNFLGLRDVNSPVELASWYSDCGADELVFYDITASAEGRGLFTDILREVASTIFIPLTVGGGISSLEDFHLRAQCSANQLCRPSGTYPVLKIIGKYIDFFLHRRNHRRIFRIARFRKCTGRPDFFPARINVILPVIRLLILRCGVQQIIYLCCDSLQRRPVPFLRRLQSCIYVFFRFPDVIAPVPHTLNRRHHQMTG